MTVSGDILGDKAAIRMDDHDHIKRLLEIVICGGGKYRQCIKLSNIVFGKTFNKNVLVQKSIICNYILKEY